MGAKRNLTIKFDRQDDALFFWWDTAGISAFCVIGAMHGVRAGLHPFIVAM